MKALLENRPKERGSREPIAYHNRTSEIQQRAIAFGSPNCLNAEQSEAGGYSIKRMDNRFLPKF